MKSVRCDVHTKQSSTPPLSFSSKIDSSSATTVPGLTYFVPNQVWVELIHEGTKEILRTFKVESQIKNMVTRKELYQENKKLWKKIKSCIPTRIKKASQKSSFLRRRYTISCIQSDTHLKRKITVSFAPIVTEYKKTLIKTELFHVADDILVSGLATLLNSCDLVCLAFTCTRYRQILLTSSLVVVSALLHKKSKYQAIISTFDEYTPRQQLKRSYRNLLLPFNQSEQSAVLGALSSFQHSCESSSMSPGFIKAWGLLRAMNLLTGGNQNEDRHTFVNKNATCIQNTRGMYMLKNVLQGSTKSIVKQLQSSNTNTSHFNLWKQEFIDYGSDTFVLNTINVLNLHHGPGIPRTVIPRVLSEICHDPSVLCVDSTPLQNLAKRILNVMKANLNYIIKTIPLTIAKEECIQLNQQTKMLLNRFQQSNNIQDRNTLKYFRNKKWPFMKIKLSLLILKGLNPGLTHQRTLALAKACGLLKNTSRTKRLKIEEKINTESDQWRRGNKEILF